ncbi:abl interactor 2 isoform X2 [Amyelois transitella]|uniref:abl interactor 2 isoform X2 n=1 Tax=Amyelois transitella TaxID=680683 RepID=UPI002990514F|nr:abl interactor 2 isoform X2 [Amyelois transitella]XP_060805850.1 abl interactor 2 isoform X2 [Amyelois transitella]
MIHGMKCPSRPAPAAPGLSINCYSSVTNWSDDPFGADLFEPVPLTQKKKPPPRPPPPKVKKQPDIPAKPSHFIRRPTVLSSLMSRKKATGHNPVVEVPQTGILNNYSSELDTHRMFPKCEPKSVQTAALIDLSSPPSSPTFTTRSSSDGLSVDSFGSDATTSTNHHNANNGNASQAESGFEDDFDLFMNTRKPVKENTFDDFSAIDPFSPVPTVNRPPISKKPVFSKDAFDSSSNGNFGVRSNGPTIIRAKPARPKAPDNSALLKNTFKSSFPVTSMSVNTTTPIQKISNGFGDSFNLKPIGWDVEITRDRESSPPMPSIPPPPPPPVVDEDLPVAWPDDLPEELADQLPDLADLDPQSHLNGHEEPYAIALYDYFTDHPDDLCFSANSKINLIRRVDHEWLYGSLHGEEGLFPSNYVEVKVPLPNESVLPTDRLGVATAIYDFCPDQPGDLAFRAGDSITVLHKLSDEWYFGECKGVKGQFPVNYVEMN